MPMNFDLAAMARISGVFCETGTFYGGGVIQALDAGFRRIASIEVDPRNQAVAREKLAEHPLSNEAEIELLLGDSAERMDQLIAFARASGSPHPVFWLDAHTHLFEDGGATEGVACPLEQELAAIDAAFGGRAIVLIDDLRIIGKDSEPIRGRRQRLLAAWRLLLRPERFTEMIRPGWGGRVSLLSLLRSAVGDHDVSLRLLDGVERRDVACVYPSSLHAGLFGHPGVRSPTESAPSATPRLAG
mgnify:CR=1 FL=1